GRPSWHRLAAGPSPTYSAPHAFGRRSAGAATARAGGAAREPARAYVDARPGTHPANGAGAYPQPHGIPGALAPALRSFAGRAGLRRHRDAARGLGPRTRGD